jgi:Fic family protein
MKASYNRDLVDLIFSYPYVKIKTLEKNNIAKRQTASVYLQQLAKENILDPIKVGKEIYYINKKLMDIISK